MTTFRRRGHFRRGKYGIEHWVSASDVTRDDWWRSSGSRSDSGESRLLLYRVFRERLASAYVNPNAECPVCGEPVFFYQNEFGSRVYFDELGPPWPKHPCTDNPEYRGKSRARTLEEPTIRDDFELDLIRRLISRSPWDAKEAFVEKYKSKPWAPYRIEWCERRDAEAILVLRGLADGSGPLLFLKAPAFTRRAPVGSLVYFSRNRLSYFAPRRAKVVEIDVERVRGAKLFVDTLLEFSRYSARRIAEP